MIGLDACSALAQAEPLAGSAPYARAWLVLEHPGPWGRQALTDSGLPDPIVQHISRAEAAYPLRFLAARRIDQDRRHAFDASTRRVWLAHVGPDGGRTITTTIDELDQLLTWDLEGISSGGFPITGETVVEPIEFICTHSKRDTCCAVLGREITGTVPTALQHLVWECSHLGGHRFAATSLFLPSGRLYGRLPSVAAVDGVLREPEPRYLRGPSYLPPDLQAAECTVRIAEGLPSTAKLTVARIESTEFTVLARVSSDQNESWLVACEQEHITSPASCGAADQERTFWRPRIIERKL